MLFCLISISVSNLKAQNVTLSHHSKSLKEAMNEIEKQTGYKFFYIRSIAACSSSCRIPSSLALTVMTTKETQKVMCARIRVVLPSGTCA